MNPALNLNELKKGNSIQQKAYQEIKRLSIFDRLEKFRPTVAGTVPIGIDTATSDLDILCQCESHTVYKRIVHQYFSNEPEFTIKSKLINDVKSTIARYKGRYFTVELFAQKTPVKLQNAYKQMIIEINILKSMPEEFRTKVVHLKRQGKKTEEAFAMLLDLKGNPYTALLKYGNENFNLNF